ncbi:MAG: LysM domain-containing protein [Methylococcales bacterium]|nr:LysM domain-containing protein [Methylococcales bacterium]
MAFRTLLGLMLALLISISSWADEIQLNPAHPAQYTVVQGDTLWDIAGRFLNHPWQWPDLWRDNSQIANPNLIYPGDTLYLTMVNGRPQMSLSRTEPQAYYDTNHTCVLTDEDLKYGRSQFAVTEDGKLMPCIRETLINQAVELIPSSSIAQYLSSPKVVGDTDLNTAPYVVDIAGEHIVAGAGDRVYVRAIPQSAIQLYTIYRAGQIYRDAVTSEILGYEAEFIADTILQKTGDPATLSITSSASEIRKGDRVMPKSEADVTLNYFPRPPDKVVNGSIISVLGGVSQIGQFNVVVIDKGTRDGLLVGHELSVYQKGRTVTDPFSPHKNEVVTLPDEEAGILMIFRPFERVSYALIMKASKAIHVLDKVRTP